MIPELIQKVIDVSGAIKDGVDFANYPKRYANRVPLRIKMIKTVMPDLMFLLPFDTDCPPAIDGNEYYCSVNAYGAVTVIFDDGRMLGVKPDEFQVIEYHG